MNRELRRWLALIAIVLLAAGLRLTDLARRPMHADEANQAVKTGLLLDGGRYAFDPHDHHGPTLYYFALTVARARGEHSLAALTETTVRLVPALFGTLAVAVLALMWAGCPHPAGMANPPGEPRLGEDASPYLNEPAGFGGVAAEPAPHLSGSALFLLAALFFALSPPAVYYARDFIQETLLVAFTLFAVFAAIRWWCTGRTGWAIATGAAIGLMLATKESAPLLLIALLAAAAAGRPPRPAAAQPVPHALLALGAAALVAALFYSSFGRNFAGLHAAVLAPLLGLDRATGLTGHEKPWWYYLRLLTWVRSGGLVWEQALFAALAVAGAVIGFWRRDRWLRAAAVYAAVLLIAISAVPYKTPWNVLHVIPPLCVLAAGAVHAIARLGTGRVVATLFAALACLMLLAHTRRAAFLLSADPRNPWAYVHSSPDVLKFRPAVAAALARTPDQPVRVISEEYWPLPWYLRGLPRVGYWTSPPADCDGALVIASAGQAEAVRGRLRGRYRESFLGLRPGFVCVVFTPAQ